MAQEAWLTAINNLENTNKWAIRAVICRMLGRLEAYDPENLDWFVEMCEMEVKQCE